MNKDILLERLKEIFDNIYDSRNHPITYVVSPKEAQYLKSAGVKIGKEDKGMEKLNEFLARTKNITEEEYLKLVEEFTKMNIPDIDDDFTLIKIIDELKYRLKARKNSPLCNEFDAFLNHFIDKHQLLDEDNHNFCVDNVLVKKWKGLLKNYPAQSYAERKRVAELLDSIGNKL